MTTEEQPGEQAWTEEASRTFVEYGDIYVPGREAQIETICALLDSEEREQRVLELCCGEGVLAAALLERHPSRIVIGYDGSALMRSRARTRLAAHGARFRAVAFDLAADAWRRADKPIHAVVSTLAIHHLDGAGKRRLYADLYRMLAPGGRLVIADLVEPAGAAAVAAAAADWDEAVRRRSLRFTGDTAAYDHFRDQQWNIFRFPDPMDKPSPLYDQLRWLDEAGFEEIDVYWLHAGHAVYGGRKPE